MMNLLAKSFGFDFSRRKIKPKIELAGEKKKKRKAFMYKCDTANFYFYGHFSELIFTVIILKEHLLVKYLKQNTHLGRTQRLEVLRERGGRRRKRQSWLPPQDRSVQNRTTRF